MQQQILGDILAKRRDRSIAIILGVKERECDRHLPPEARTKLRKVVLDQLNDFHDLCADLIRSLDAGGDVVVNEVYVEKLDAIHDTLSRLEAASNGSG